MNPDPQLPGAYPVRSKPWPWEELDLQTQSLFKEIHQKLQAEMQSRAEILTLALYNSATSGPLTNPARTVASLLHSNCSPPQGLEGLITSRLSEYSVQLHGVQESTTDEPDVVHTTIPSGIMPWENRALDPGSHWQWAFREICVMLQDKMAIDADEAKTLTLALYNSATSVTLYQPDKTTVGNILRSLGHSPPVELISNVTTHLTYYGIMHS
ncbi:hypothetical protein FB45DRAFT_1025391 [Roridomyces roridus]|uniref:Uncharacterized protein n=1 Tax=Roridomyces roridus TaxID=1738132 RepID=A0AAD7BYK2_9AGAR|nr:hypothetical protein FB45DRAFT_1025391 [Roridomyces roridus]